MADWVLYVRPDEINSDNAQSLVHPEMKIKIQDPALLTADMFPRWLDGTPILGDIKTGKIYKGTKCLGKLWSLGQACMSGTPQSEDATSPEQRPIVSAMTADRKRRSKERDAGTGFESMVSDDTMDAPLPPPDIDRSGVPRGEAEPVALPDPYHTTAASPIAGPGEMTVLVTPADSGSSRIDSTPSISGPGTTPRPTTKPPARDGQRVLVSSVEPSRKSPDSAIQSTPENSFFVEIVSPEQEESDSSDEWFEEPESASLIVAPETLVVDMDTPRRTPPFRRPQRRARNPPPLGVQ